MLTTYYLSTLFFSLQFVAPEKFDAEAKQMFRFQKHLGELVIAPVFVQRQCDSDKEDYEVNIPLFKFWFGIPYVLFTNECYFLTQ